MSHGPARIDDLAEAIDQLLGKGVVLAAEIELRVADIALCHVSARLLAETAGRVIDNATTADAPAPAARGEDGTAW